MKRHALLKHLKKQGCKKYREGTHHTIFWNPSNLKTTSIPRHQEIGNKLAAKICEDLSVDPPK